MAESNTTQPLPELIYMIKPNEPVKAQFASELADNLQGEGFAMNTIINSALGLDVHPEHYPRNAGDICRCMELYEMAPMLFAPKYLRRVSDISHVWESVVWSWEELTPRF